MSEITNFLAARYLPPEWQIAWWLVLAIVLLVVALTVVAVLPDLARSVHAARTERATDPDETTRLGAVIQISEYRESPDRKGVVS